MSTLRILVIDDQLGSSSIRRRQFLDDVGCNEGNVESPYLIEMCSGQDGTGRNSVDVVLDKVRQYWPREDGGERWALILMDIRFDEIPPSGNGGTFGLFLVERLREAFGPELPIVMLTGEGGGNREESNRLAADGYLPKESLSPDALREQVERNGLSTDNRNVPVRLIGGSLAVMKVLREARRYTLDPRGSRLIYGETGTGKTELARYIHDKSPSRASGPFQKWTVETANDQLVKDKLFGHWKGAFVGAEAPMAGAIELAHNGTFLLDEVADLSPAVQQMFLAFRNRGRADGKREIDRLGICPVEARKAAATKEGLTGALRAKHAIMGELQRTGHILVDALVLTATNIDLRESDVRKQKEFRVDLFNDLGSCIVFPSLNERRADVPLIFKYWLEKSGAATASASKEVLDWLINRDWSNQNVAKLKQIAEHAVNSLGGNFETVYPRHLSRDDQAELSGASVVRPAHNRHVEHLQDESPLEPTRPPATNIMPNHVGGQVVCDIEYLKMRVIALERAFEQSRETDPSSGQLGPYSPTRAIAFMYGCKVAPTDAKRQIKDILKPILDPDAFTRKALERGGLADLRKDLSGRPLLMAFYDYASSRCSSEEANARIDVEETL